jgi:transcriptional regulator with XRE-family HTH domain
MTASEAAAARRSAGLTLEDLADELGVTPGIVRAWEAGAVAVPRRHAQHLAHRAAVAEREAALAASGLAECGRVAELLSAAEVSPLDETPACYEAVEAHARACPLCQARERFVAERFGPLPEPPTPAWLRPFEWLERAPAWARPAILGAAGLAAVVSLRVLVALPAVVSNPRKLGEALVAVLAAAAAGAAGGLAYSATRPTLKRLGPAGDYLTGIVCVLAYLGALALAAPYAFGERLIESRSDAVIFAVGAIGFGVFIGHSWFREPRQRTTTGPGPAA